jgi:hypothetical protein
MISPQFDEHFKKYTIETKGVSNEKKPWPEILRFLLTGSITGKLRKKGVNLLGGRARTRRLFPFVYKELNNDFDLLRALDTGLIPI